MSQDDPKPTGNPEDEASEEASRRRFLKGGAAAAVGVLAASVVPKAAEAVVFEPNGTTPVTPVNYYETLAGVILEAWRSDTYQAELLADPKVVLARVGLFFQDVKVLTEAEYAGGYTRKRNEIIFVLPNKRSEVSLDRAKEAMQVTPFGM